MNNESIDESRRGFVGVSALFLSSADVGVEAIAPRPASAQVSTVKEPAVTGNPDRSDVIVERAVYKARSIGTDIVGNLFKPSGFDPGRQYPAIVITHPNGGVKEQTAGLYALRLAQRGFVTLAFDASYQGESGGTPRLMELPTQRADDISSSIDFLVAQSFVDVSRIGSLGICAGGSYALSNAQTEPRAKAIATVSMFDMGDARRNGMRGTAELSYDQRMDRLNQAAEARTREARREPPTLVPIVPDSADAFNAQTPDLYREAHEYYRTARAQHPNSPNRYMLSSLPASMAFFPFAQIETISPRPLLMVAGSKADTKFWSDEAFAKAAEPKELHVIEGATHVDLYDKPQYVTPTAEKLASFFARHLVAS